MHTLLAKLKDRFPDAVLAVREEGPYKDLVAQVKAPAVPDIARFLRDDGEMSFDMLSDICSVDYPEDEDRFEVIYLLKSLPHNHRLRMKARLPEDAPVIPTVTPIWRGANFLEREVYDMMGIRFEGHPDLRRILMPEDYEEGFPLRKDFPVEGKGWRTTFPFLPKLDEPAVASSAEEVPAEQQRPFLIESETESNGDKPVRRQEELLLNMGPQHPATHGVLRVVLELEGERIVKATPDLGYLHRGVEKLSEALTYQQIIPHTDRLDYVCSMLNNYAFVRAVEKLLELTIPPRAEYIRTTVAEMQRIIGHLFWLGTQALDIGAMTVFFWTFREREVLLDMFEKLCGARLTLNYYRVGGVDSDFTPDLVQKMQAFLDTFPAHIAEYDELLTGNPIWQERLTGVGVITTEQALALSASGPILRSTGFPWDLRKSQPYLAYDEVDFDVIYTQNGDCYDRYRIRLSEILESVKIVRQCVEKMPPGDYRVQDRKVTPPPRARIDESMEALIHHFKLFTEGFKVPPGETYAAVESPRGEVGCYLVADGTGKPCRLHIRGPSFYNLQSMTPMMEDRLIADAVAVISSVDPIMGEVDR